MPRKPNPVPTYRLHKQSGQAVATVRLPDGTRRDVLLGKYDSPESKAEYERLLASLRVSPVAAIARTKAQPASAGLTVNELLLAFVTHADSFYRTPDGGRSGELENFRYALRPVRLLYGDTLASEFCQLALKAVRQRMIDDGLCRTVVNARVNRIRRAWKWAAGEGLIPFESYQRLTLVAGLSKGRTPAREAEPVGPVPIPDVLATLPHLGRHVAAMVRLQLHSGMRPGEVRRLRASEVDTSSKVWTYTPAHHKSAHRGKTRRVKLGPQAQAVLSPFLVAATDPNTTVFTRERARKGRTLGAMFTRWSYCQAVERAAAKAGVGHWHPNQLRHTFATEVRRKYGLEAAQVLLGHSKASTTEIYAERDDGLAERVAAVDG